ncbi:hypothetical protein ABZ297_18650 [Nonomuraea sp. NPDC005983]|uniref:hypothetical protein n=1 Tax=Nonomuraea sp. NPDC005983 TaxID=3155595 RepID=UPI0033B4C813
MQRRSLALAALALVAGCGGTGAAARPSAGPTSAQGRDFQIETLKADCMKGKGFKYVAWVHPDEPLTDEDKQRLSPDFATRKAYRATHGFDLMYRQIHGGPESAKDAPVDPNYAIRDDLSPAQQKAYGKASDGCEAEAIKKVTGKVVKSVGDWRQQLNKLYAQRMKRELDGDPQLVELATAKADCLTAKGYQVSSTKPTVMGDWGRQLVERELHERARKEDKGIPPYDPDSGVAYGTTRLTDQEKRQYLQKEIKTAVDDLECGKDFDAAFSPKATQIWERVSQ